jgi:hypothetical protein
MSFTPERKACLVFTRTQLTHCGLSNRGHASLLHSNRSAQRNAAKRSPPFQSAVSRVHILFLPSDEMNTAFLLTESKGGVGNMLELIKKVVHAENL